MLEFEERKDCALLSFAGSSCGTPREGMELELGLLQERG